MWQFAMNSPAEENCRATFGAGNGAESGRLSRLLSLACFAALAALHIAALSAFGFPVKSERPGAETGELSLALEFADSGPGALKTGAEPPPPPAPLLQEELPPPAPREDPVSREEVASDTASPAVAETALPAAASFPASGEGVSASAAAPAGFASSAPARKAMTHAEYLALVMERLEKNKLYPLAVRKRGIEGDITTAFTIRQDGTVSDMTLADPSGHRFLAQAAFETIRSASPFPVMEGHDGEYTVQVSIRYRLEDETSKR
jgi:TonB family protein